MIKHKTEDEKLDDERFQNFLMNKNFQFMRFLKNPSSDILLYKLLRNAELYGWVIQKFENHKNFNDEIKEKILLHNPLSIRFFKNPTEKMCDVAVRTNPQALQFIPQQLIDSLLERRLVGEFNDDVLDEIIKHVDLQKLSIKTIKRLLYYFPIFFNTFKKYLTHDDIFELVKAQQNQNFILPDDIITPKLCVYLLIRKHPRNAMRSLIHQLLLFYNQKLPTYIEILIAKHHGIQVILLLPKISFVVLRNFIKSNSKYIPLIFKIYGHTFSDKIIDYIFKHNPELLLRLPIDCAQFIKNKQKIINIFINSYNETAECWIRELLLSLNLDDIPEELIKNNHDLQKKILTQDHIKKEICEYNRFLYNHILR